MKCFNNVMFSDMLTWLIILIKYNRAFYQACIYKKTTFFDKPTSGFDYNFFRSSNFCARLKFSKNSHFKNKSLHVIVSWITIFAHRCSPMAHRDMIYTLSTSGRVPIRLSTLQTERTKLYRNSLFRNEPHKILGLG